MKKLKVYLKFRAENGKEIGFVTKEKSAWIGCYETDSRPKRVVVADANISSQIKDGVLYKATLIPMKAKNGFVAISASPVEFEAQIETIMGRDKFKILISFGNKVVEYNPFSKSEKKTNLSKIILLLKERNDIKDKERVISDFNEAAVSALNYFGLNG